MAVDILTLIKQEQKSEKGKICSNMKDFRLKNLILPLQTASHWLVKKSESEKENKDEEVLSFPAVSIWLLLGKNAYNTI